MEKQNICKPLPESVTSPHAMDMSPIENSVSGVWEDDEFITQSSINLNTSFSSACLDPDIEALDASITEYKKRKVLELMGSTAISKDELGKQVIAQLPKLYDGVLDNLLNHSFVSRKELMHIIISQFVEQGEFDQQLSLMLKQAAADWIKEKEKMSSDADGIFVTRVPESKLTR